MAVDPLVVKVRLDTILQRISRLEIIKEKKEEEFLRDDLLQSFAERNLQVIAQSIIDICTHIIAHNHWGSPERYSDAIRIITDKQVIDTELASNLIKFIKLRNILVHLYLEIDLKIVYESALEIISDAKQFVNAITDLLDYKNEEKVR